jgi:signal transduction histidine kinase
VVKQVRPFCSARDGVIVFCSSASPDTPGGEALHAQLRSNVDLLKSAAVVALLIGLTLLDGMQTWLRVSTMQMTLVLAPFMVVHTATALIHRHFGVRSRAYDLADRLETITVSACIYTLVFLSSSSVNLFWLCAFAYGCSLASVPTNWRFHLGVQLGAVALTTLAFLYTGNSSAALTALGVGLLGIPVFGALVHNAQKLEAVTRERARLQEELVELRGLEERARIARDLHDGLGAELAALIWRARGLQQELDGLVSRPVELSAFADRLKVVLDEVRSIVWALDARGQSWLDAVSYLRDRGAELCADRVSFELIDEGAPTLKQLPGELRLQLVRSVKEAVRNAVRHGRPNRVRVRLQAADQLRVEVEDDGVGLPAGALERSRGGLQNLKARAQLSGGSFSIEPAHPGTRVRWSLALPEVVSPGPLEATT